MDSTISGSTGGLRRPLDSAVLDQLKDAVDMLAEQNRQQRARAGLLSDVSLALARTASLGETLRACADAIVQHFDVALARIWTLATGGSVLDPQASAGMYTHADGASGRVQVGSSKIGEIARSSEAHITSNLLDDLEAGDRDWARQNGVVAFAGYPLICNARVLGVLAVFSRSALSEAHTAALQSVAEVLGQAIDRKRQEEAAISHASQIIRLARIAAEIPDGPESRPDLRSILSQIASLASRAPELAAYSAGFAVPNPSSSDGAVSS